MKSYYIECMCQSLEHTIRVCVDKEDEFTPLWIDVHLIQYRPWYKRVWPAIRYIFGHKSKFGDFDTCCLERAQAEKIIAAIREVYPLRESATGTLSPVRALRIIEGLVHECDSPLASEIYKIAHQANSPHCNKNHPKWTERALALEREMVESGTIPPWENQST